MSNICKLKIILLLFTALFISSCSKENIDSLEQSQQIIIYVDSDIDEGTKAWLYSLQEQFVDYNLKYVTNVVTNKKYFLDSMIENNFDSDIIFSKYLTKENSPNLANLAGKSFFPASSFNALKKMDQEGNIYLVPFTDTKKYLILNKSFFEEKGLTPPETAKDILEYMDLLKQYPESIYINFNSANSIANELFNYAFTLTDGLTIKGYKWANDLEKGLTDVSSYNFSKTFDFLDYFKGLDLQSLSSNKIGLQQALTKLSSNEIAIFEVNTSDINQIEPYFNKNIIAIPFNSTLDGKDYVISHDQVYIGVNKKSMETKKTILNELLAFIFSNVGEIDVIYDTNSIFNPLIGLSSSVYDTYYKSINNYEKNQIADFYNFQRGKDYLSTSVEQYLLGKIDRDEFINYWQQDVLVSKFELNKVPLANTASDLSPLECSMIIAKAMYDQVDCDVSAVTISNLTDDFHSLNTLYSSSPYFIKKGEIYWEDIYNLVPINIKSKLINSINQQLLYAILTGEQLINLFNEHSNDLAYYGIKKIDGIYYVIKKNGTTEEIILDGYYNFITNSNFYLKDFELPNPILYNKSVIDCLNKWIIENNAISDQAVLTYNIVAN
ncbi:MAG: extracellular solute-binding protein [Sphaerochaetaceae bacterium]|nr:extracellular solute-binding protein [Sphaerochaetaceae bacterium]MDC7248733.1 extracellular solute-binding protein [Sphaerochaetaceae bacterium]